MADRRTTIAYSLPALVMALPTVPVYILLPTFYVEHTALTLTTVGLLLGAARVLDLFSDIFAGRWCEHPLGRFGKRRGWIMLGALILAPALWALFTPAADSGARWLFGWALLLYLGWTLVQIPYLAWSTDLAPTYQQRLSLNSSREFMGLIGLLVSAAVPAVGGQLGWTSPQIMQVLAGLAITFGIVAFTWMIRVVPEPPVSQPDKRTPTAIAAQAPSWLALFSNRLWLRLLTAWTLNGVANGIAAVLFPIIITSLLGAPASSRGQFLLIYFLSAIGGIALMRLLGPHMSKHRLWCAAMLAATGAFALVPLLGEGDLIGFMAVCVVTGVALAADLALPPSIQADVVDWDRWRFRRNHPALSFAGASLVTKLALGIAVVTGPLLVSASGWTETGPVSNSVALRLAMIYAWIPCVLKIMAIAIVWNFPLDERRHDMVRSRLRRYSGDYLCADN